MSMCHKKKLLRMELGELNACGSASKTLRDNGRVDLLSVGFKSGTEAGTVLLLPS
jgi:hypothetical protein